MSERYPITSVNCREFSRVRLLRPDGSGMEFEVVDLSAWLERPSGNITLGIEARITADVTTLGKGSDAPMTSTIESVLSPPARRGREDVL